MSLLTCNASELFINFTIVFGAVELFLFNTDRSFHLYK